MRPPHATTPAATRKKRARLPPDEAAARVLPPDCLRHIFLAFHKSFWINPVNQLVFSGKFFTRRGVPLGVSTKLRVHRQGLVRPRFAVTDEWPGHFERGTNVLLRLDGPLEPRHLRVLASYLLRMGDTRERHHRMEMFMVATGQVLGTFSCTRDVVHPTQRMSPIDGPLAYVSKVLLRFLELHDVPVAPSTVLSVAAAGRRAGFGETLPRTYHFS